MMQASGFVLAIATLVRRKIARSLHGQSEPRE